MRAIPYKVVRHTTHKTLVFLMLEMAHHLGHVHAQPFYLIKLRHFQLVRLRVWWEQLLFLKSGHPSSWCGISPVLIPVEVLWTQNRFSESMEAASPPASLQGYIGCQNLCLPAPFWEGLAWQS